MTKLSEFQPIAGVYKITCLINGRVYIGSSISLETRAREHVKELINNKHKTKELQADFIAHGINAFDFEILELCDKKALGEREFYHMRNYLRQGFDVYNYVHGNGKVFKNR